jgi:hypothetical protein
MFVKSKSVWMPGALALLLMAVVRGGSGPLAFSPPAAITSLEYRYQVQAMDSDEDEIIYELAAGPDGMTIDPATGIVSWSIPEEAAGEH